MVLFGNCKWDKQATPKTVGKPAEQRRSRLFYRGKEGVGKALINKKFTPME